MNIPTFVIAGQPNEGKTTVIATLTEDDKAIRGPVEGMTREQKRYSVKIDGAEKFVIFDTPGFENPGELLEWFRANSSHHQYPAAAFLDVHTHLRDFPLDCEIMKPIAGGAAVIHVADPGRSPRDVDAYEAEIFRLCKVPRVGLLNSRAGAADHRQEWESLLTKEEIQCREFNACEAIFIDRIALLNAFTVATPDWQKEMVDVVKALEDEWRERLSEIASSIVQTLRKAVQIQVFEPCDSEGLLEAAKVKAEKCVRKKISELEDNFRSDARQMFRHETNHWEAGGMLDVDLFDERVWRLFGFSKKALVFGCAFAGAGIGTLIDIATGGGTMGIGAVVGVLVGGIGGYLSADKAVDMSLPKFRVGPFALPSGKIGGRSIKAGIERRSKLPGILLDRMACYTVAATRWPHGRLPEAGDLSAVDESWRISHALENSGESKAVSRIQVLVELWYRSKEKTLGTKEEKAIRDTEGWLRDHLVAHFFRATHSKDL